MNPDNPNFYVPPYDQPLMQSDREYDHFRESYDEQCRFEDDLAAANQAAEDAQ